MLDLNFSTRVTFAQSLAAALMLLYLERDTMYYHQEALQQGGRVRDRLRDGVEKALTQLGTGFLQHPDNDELRQKFELGKLSHTDYYRQLLKLIYRLLFLMVSESRNLLLTGDDPEKTRIYREYYSAIVRTELSGYDAVGAQGFITGMRFNPSWTQV